jgi:hypothetical protein
MRLVEFQGDSSRLPLSVANILQNKLGQLERVGGPKRVYELGEDHLGVVYVLGNSTKAIGLAWSRSTGAIGVDSIYVWEQFDISREPDYVLDIPVTGSFLQMADQVAEWINHPSVGKEGEVNESVELDEMARRSNAQEFMRMAVAKFGDAGASKITMPQMMALAAENEVQIPGDVRMGNEYKVDAHHWNLSGHGAGEPDQTDTELGKAMGGPVEAPDASVDPAYQDALALAKAKTVRRLAGQGKIYLMGRKPKGAWFRIPGLEDYSAQLERMLGRELETTGGKGDSMDEQYDMLHDKVKLVAGGESNFIKSLLITGAPSSGKTFVVMKTINELGLKPGVNYIVKKGRITTVALYRTLIEQIDGMVIFDDCDSVVDDKNAVNMLKGALDTDPVREISYDVRGTINTGVLEPKERDIYVEKISRILRGKPEEGDLETFERYVINSKNEDDFDDIPDDDETPEGDEAEGGTGKYRYSYNLLLKTQAYLERHLPNKIDFRGRIIFISNMDESEWDSAILTRAFSINMNFSSADMLDYIDKIKGHIKTPGLTDEMKQEVMDYLRELYTTGKLKRQVNFRLVQQCFDLRLTDNWRKLMTML